MVWRVRAVKFGGVCVAGVLGLVAWGLPATPALAKPKPPPTGPLTLTPISADAGYFLAEGTCPKRTKTVRYTWTGAANGNGWGDWTPPALTFSTPVRMQAAAPGGEITVALECRAWDNRVLMLLGPVTTVSGTALMPDPPPDSGTGRRIVYALAAQQVWLIAEDNSVVHTHLVSGRRLKLTTRHQQLGTFKVTLKRVLGCDKPTRCPNMVHFHLTGGQTIGFHQIPYGMRSGKPFQSEAELGQPRSHGCVRQSTADAKFLFDWVVKGDAVWVVP